MDGTLQSTILDDGDRRTFVFKSPPGKTAVISQGSQILIGSSTRSFELNEKLFVARDEIFRRKWENVIRQNVDIALVIQLSKLKSTLDLAQRQFPGSNQPAIGQVWEILHKTEFLTLGVDSTSNPSFQLKLDCKTSSDAEDVRTSLGELKRLADRQRSAIPDDSAMNALLTNVLDSVQIDQAKQSVAVTVPKVESLDTTINRCVSELKKSLHVKDDQ